MTEQQVRDRLREACRTSGGQKAWAGKHNISVPYVNDVLFGRRKPGELILSALGLRRVVSYEECR